MINSSGQFQSPQTPGNRLGCSVFDEMTESQCKGCYWETKKISRWKCSHEPECRLPKPISAPIPQNEKKKGKIRVDKIATHNCAMEKCDAKCNGERFIGGVGPVCKRCRDVIDKRILRGWPRKELLRAIKSKAGKNKSHEDYFKTCPCGTKFKKPPQITWKKWEESTIFCSNECPALKEHLKNIKIGNRNRLGKKCKNEKC